jgi:hypothetical protein
MKSERRGKGRVKRELLAFNAISDPDFGFGVDPGRLRGYPLAHLAGTWW